jgi:hypothetical protein
MSTSRAEVKQPPPKVEADVGTELRAIFAIFQQLSLLGSQKARRRVWDYFSSRIEAAHTWPDYDGPPPFDE